MTDFGGKTVLITGAAGGIGREMARYFGARGGRVAALDKSPAVIEFAAELTEAGITAAGAIADIASNDAVESAFDALRGQLGPIDVLINNAGFSVASTLETTTPDAWQSTIDGNLNGAYFCSRLAIEDMKAAGAGAIVAISSVNGLTSLGDPSYSAAKAGLISFTKAQAMEYGRFGIRANVICPGTVRTPIWAERVERDPEILSTLVKWYPLRRVVDPIDIAKAAGFLASDDAAAITGVVLPVDCGVSAGNIVMSRELTLADF
jgi:NAD(P)-dependent dehydrogenase (short-subunit alcohol dehydrogenase family)